MSKAFLRVPGFSVLLNQIRHQSIPAWLVGGCLRDWFLGLSLHDIDVALAGDCHSVGKQLAEKCGGSWFWLDRQRGQVRVLCPSNGGPDTTYDLVPLEGGSLPGDLARRDFTVNAMSLLLPDFSDLYDPYNGRRDLEGKLLRMTSPEAIAADPLRVLRGLRFVHLLGFGFDGMTREILQRTAPMLGVVAGERISQELARILERPVTDFLFRFFLSLQPHNWLDIRQTGQKSDDLLPLRRLEGLLLENGDLTRLAKTRIGSGFSAAALVRLYLLLRPGDRTEGRKLAQRLRLSGACRKVLEALGRKPVPAFPPETSARALDHWVARLPGGPVCGLLSCLVSREMSLGCDMVNKLVRSASHVVAEGPPGPLLPAREVGTIIGVPEGPLLGRIMEELAAAEVRGDILNKTDAVKWLKKQRKIGIDKGKGDA